MTKPIGIDVSTIRFNWSSDGKGQHDIQSGFRLLVATAPELLLKGGADIFDSGIKHSDKQSMMASLSKLKSYTRYYWLVKSFDKKINRDWFRR